MCFCIISSIQFTFRCAKLSQLCHLELKKKNSVSNHESHITFNCHVSLASFSLGYFFCQKKGRNDFSDIEIYYMNCW